MLRGFNHFTIAVRNVDRSFRFYRDVLGLKPILRWPGGAYLLAGENWFCINLDDKARTQPNEDYTHLAFTVTQNEFSSAVKNLEENGAVRFQENLSEGDSVYFLDPDGHKLEIHVGNWQSRLAYFRSNPKPEMEFFI